ncbi:MAG TPA: phosphoribosylformylglycinamidine cyclo-ligase [Candidatus Binataceae bacterium]
MKNRTKRAGLSYKDAGVDIELKQALIPQFRRIAMQTSHAHVIGGVGGFGAIVGLNGASKMAAPVLVAGTDSVGTKLKIAFATGRHDTVGIDCVAMCVNDIICLGARPMFFLDYIGAGKLDREIAIQIVKGVARGCREAGASLVGGETAQLAGLYRPGEYDLVGFAVGIADRSRVPRPNTMRSGDALIGLSSTGLHSNGFSLARKVLLERGKMKLDEYVAALNSTLADELLRPTKIYARLAIEMFERFEIKGLANITGGGLLENVPRILPTNLSAHIRRGSWQVPPIFDLIAKMGRISRSEMDRTFNNGVGMVAVAAQDRTDPLLRWLRSRRQTAFVIGELRRGADSGAVIE